MHDGAERRAPPHGRVAGAAQRGAHERASLVSVLENGEFRGRDLQKALPPARVPVAAPEAGPSGPEKASGPPQHVGARNLFASRKRRSTLPKKVRDATCQAGNVNNSTLGVEAGRVGTVGARVGEPKRKEGGRHLRRTKLLGNARPAVGGGRGVSACLPVRVPTCRTDEST
jgi:hypothetical protein